MRWSQRVILAVAAATVLVMALFPPYRITAGALARGDGYHFIGSNVRGAVDIYRWFIQYIAVATIAGIVYWIAGSLPIPEKRSQKPSPETETRTETRTLLLCVIAGVLLSLAILMIYLYL